MKRCIGPNVYTAPPDGGWGWVVAVSFFLVEVFTYGVIKSLGIFLQDLMGEFGESNSRVSWIISICVFVMAFTGETRGSIRVSGWGVFGELQGVQAFVTGPALIEIIRFVLS